MNEQEIQKFVEAYFAQHAKEIQQELLELQKDYVRRKLQEKKENWEVKMRENADEFDKQITEMLKSAYVK